MPETSGFRLSLVWATPLGRHTKRLSLYNLGGILSEISQQVSRDDLIHRHHPGFHVLVDVTVEHPRPDSVRNHVGSHKLSRPNREDVRVVLIECNYVSVPVRRVVVDLAPHSHHVPAHLFAAFHRRHW